MLKRAHHTAGRPVIARCRAITLLEVLVTLSATAFILTLGVPSIANWIHVLEVRDSAGDLVAALQGARNEALARNQDVRVTLGDAQGRAVWTFGCANVTASCPRRLRGVDVPAARLARWGATLAAGSPALAVALPAGSSLPAQVTFNALGAAPATGGGTEVSRIDVSHASDATARRLVVLVGRSGMVRLCDPAAAAGQTMSCS